MADLPLYDKSGKSSGTVSVDEKLFGDKVRTRLLHQVVLIYEANKRQGTASTKGRGEVEGSTRKPWPQKHTGMARAGTIRSPLWRHGGVVFGPKPREYRMGLTSTMRAAALDSAMLGKIRDKEVLVIEGFNPGAPPKTKNIASTLAAMGLDRTVLVGIKALDANLHKAARNLPRFKMVPVSDFNAYDVLKHHRVVLTREALDALVASRRDQERAPKASVASPSGAAGK
ncbi:MAG TPA: 50S ribosomal protein L4 [Planctomycetota bacterium]|nr:50S ribosomal protein L4 [Planctomycetota bacterium]